MNSVTAKTAGKAPRRAMRGKTKLPKQPKDCKERANCNTTCQQHNLPTKKAENEQIQLQNCC